MSTKPQEPPQDPVLPLGKRILSFLKKRTSQTVYLLPFFVILVFAIGAQVLPAHASGGFVFFFLQPIGGPEPVEVVPVDTAAGINVSLAQSPGGNFIAATLNPALGTGNQGEGSAGAGEDDGEDPEFVLDALDADEDAFFAATLSPLTIETSRNDRRMVVSYTIESGDSLSTVAAEFGITTSSILWANKLSNPDLIQPGDMLTIPPVSGVLHTIKAGDTVSTIAKKYRADEERIIAFNGLPADGALQAGDTVMVPDGVIIPPPPPPRPKSSSRYTSNTPAQPSSGSFLYPTTGRWVRGVSRYHRGVDIANSCGTPVYAVDAGVVVRSDGVGWNGGFGKVIVTRHPNGVETLYAHGSALYVETGQSVNRGQTIMAMGTTGRSSGCHLHIEVHGAKNPF